MSPRIFLRLCGVTPRQPQPATLWDRIRAELVDVPEMWPHRVGSA